MVGIVVGTRPGIVKMSPLIRECDRRGIDYAVYHTGQHYSPSMDRAFFRDLELPEPDYQLESAAGLQGHGEKTAAMLVGCERYFRESNPSTVLVCGDANTNLAAGLAARKLGIRLGHVESGLRSFDWSMPEEHNRVILDHISELLFAPTENCAGNLRKDGVQGKVFVVGNTIVDAVEAHREIAADRSSVLRDLNLDAGEYLLATAHREENVDDVRRLGAIFESLNQVGVEFDLPVVLPVHPRTADRIESFGLDTSDFPEVRFIQPIGYLDFLHLLSNTKLVLTDSGGIQEESCVLRVPCVTLRENTERPETVTVGANIVAGVAKRDVCAAARLQAGAERSWQNPFGTGDSASRIMDCCLASESEAKFEATPWS